MADDIPSRVAVLEQIARSTQAALERIDARLERIERNMVEDFRFLVRLHMTQFAALAAGFILLLGVIARSQHWI